MVINDSLLRSTHLVADYFYTLHLLYLHQNMGRYKLAQLLNISKAQTRVVLSKLAKAKLIEKSSQRLGHQLSSQGNEFLVNCHQFLQIPTQRIYLGRSYTIGKKDAVVCVEGTGVEQLNTVVLRDEALMNGALGCTVFLKDRLQHFFLLDAVYPPLPQMPLSDRKVRKKLSALTMEIPWQNIVIIVGTADHVISAQIGAISAAFLLVPEDIKRYFQDIIK